MRRLKIAATAALAAATLTTSAPAADLEAARCFGSATVTGKYCIDTEGSCLLASYSWSPAGTSYICYVRNP
jgi:hypothetical protein